MVKVSMISTPPEDNSGVGKYTRSLQKQLSEFVTIDTQFIPVDSSNPFPFVKNAITAAIGDHDIVHVQYDYVLFGKFSIFTIGFFPLLYFLTRITHIPVVVTMHEVINDELVNSPFKKTKEIYVKVLNMILANTTDHIIFLSRQTEKRFTKSTSVRNISQIPHGVTESPRKDLTSVVAKQEFGYNPRDIVIAEPGYVSPRKGSRMLVSLARRLPEYEFLLAGGSPRDRHNEYLKDIVDQAPDNLQVTGILNDEEYELAYIASDLIILPYQETQQGGVTNTVAQSGVFNDCVAREVPVLTSECEYFTTLQEKWGCLEVFTNIEEAERKIQEYIQDEKRRCQLTEHMSEFKEANSMREVALEHQDIYQSIV
jgi:glycosyltransferase involved in cell wall biosynthesis